MDKLRDEYLLLPQEAASLHPPVVDYWKSLQELTTYYKENLIKPLVQALQTLAEALQPVFKEVCTVIQAVNDALYAAYLKDGAIYGETQEGMLRWMKERGEIERLKMEAERLEQRQEMIRDFKRMLAKKRSL